MLWALGSVVGNVRSLAQAHEAYDRTLLGSALVISERLSLVDGEVVADLPYAALEMLRTDAQDRIFYRVADLRDGRYVTGYEDLPAPASPTGEGPVFYDAVYKDQDIRIVAVKYALLDDTEQRQLLVQVAETLDARRQLSTSHRDRVGGAATSADRQCRGPDRAGGAARPGPAEAVAATRCASAARTT